MKASFSNTAFAQGIIRSMSARAGAAMGIQTAIEQGIEKMLHNNTEPLNLLINMVIGEPIEKRKGDKVVSRYIPVCHPESTEPLKTQELVRKDLDLIIKYVGKLTGATFKEDSDHKTADGKWMLKMPDSWKKATDKEKRERVEKGQFPNGLDKPKVLWNEKVIKVAVQKAPKPELEKLQKYIAALHDKDMVAALQVYIADHLEKDIRKLKLAREERMKQEA
jgi:hypothetical protein